MYFPRIRASGPLDITYFSLSHSWFSCAFIEVQHRSEVAPCPAWQIRSGIHRDPPRLTKKVKPLRHAWVL